MSNDLTLNFFVLRGDLNRDGIVSIADFITLASNFGKTNATYADGDVNYDGSVTIADFIELSSNFNKSIPAPASTARPQPAAAETITISSDAKKHRRAASVHKRATQRRHHRRQQMILVRQP